MIKANLGIVFRKNDRKRVLSAVPPRLRTWGNETFVEEGPQRFVAQGLEGVEFELYPITKFIRDRLPSNEQTHELEYAWMTGPALETYETWAQANRDVRELHALETGLAALFAQSFFWALMFAPEGERLGNFITVNANEAVQELRRGASDISASPGFLAICS